MPTTTTIRIPDKLKARIARAAQRAGKTPHGFILEAIAAKTEAEERSHDFRESAEQRYAGILVSGKTIPWSAMRRYLTERLAGKPGNRPAAKKLAR